MSTSTNWEINDEIVKQYGIPRELNGGQSILKSVDIRIDGDDFPRIVVEYVMIKKQEDTK